MGSSHCATCGAMSTIWTQTCVFCGTSIEASSGERTLSVLQVAMQDDPAPATTKDQPRRCTSRVYKRKAPGLFDGMLDTLRAFWSRMLHKPARV